LGIAGEAIYPVPSLSLSDPNPATAFETVAGSEAAQLFVERARLVQPDFALTRNNALPVAQVCQQLDGIPLAIELTATRLRLLTLQQIIERLDDRFRLLTSGSRTALPRHQTLQALIDWSYDLLPEPERALFGRLAVFAGGWTLEAAEAVGAGEGVEAQLVLDLLMQLANKSLVVVERKQVSEARYRLLDTIRQYALAKLVAKREAEAVQRRHAEYYLSLLEIGALYESPAVFHRFEPEVDNLRAALTWSLLTPDSAELALRLASVAPTAIWQNSIEGRDYLESALAHADARGVGGTHARAEVLYQLGQVLAGQGDYAAGQARLALALRLFQELGDRPASASVLTRLGWLARERGDVATARRLLEESVAIFRELGDKPGIAEGLVNLGEVAVMQEDAASARSLLEEALALKREQGSAYGSGWALNHLGHVAQIQGEYERATRLHEESLALFSQFGKPHGSVAEAWYALGETALAQGKALLATQHLTRALALLHDIESFPIGIAWCLAGLAGVAVLDEEPERAARLWGAAEALRLSIGAQLGEVAFAEAWAKGQAMTMEQAVAEALEDI
jgi:predicted ATPase/Flp pilus assembly protein TadD